jgi:hypothetical protein
MHLNSICRRGFFGWPFLDLFVLPGYGGDQVVIYKVFPAPAVLWIALTEALTTVDVGVMIGIVLVVDVACTAQGAGEPSSFI